MAKWGEGDPRWIVEERPDATNVNNWHWVEKNATPWSQQRLRELLLGQHLEKGPIKIDFTEFKKLEGEATANNRKAKLIFFFEWVIEIEFKATIAGSDIEYKGTVEIANLSDENEGHEIDISSHITTNGPHDQELLYILNVDGLQFIREQAGTYIRELKEEFSKGIILPTEKEAAKPQVISKGKTILDKKSFQNNVVGGATKDMSGPRAASVGSVSEFELIETFKVPPDRLYEILTEPDLVRAWSSNSSVIDAREGGSFSLLGGVISGQFTSLIKNKEISMQWRLKSYPSDYYADVKLILWDKDDSTDLQVKASRVPENALEDTKTGFSRYYFQHIGKRFGISLRML